MAPSGAGLGILTDSTCACDSRRNLRDCRFPAPSPPSAARHWGGCPCSTQLSSLGQPISQPPHRHLFQLLLVITKSRAFGVFKHDCKTDLHSSTKHFLLVSLEKMTKWLSLGENMEPTSILIYILKCYCFLFLFTRGTDKKESDTGAQ